MGTPDVILSVIAGMAVTPLVSFLKARKWPQNVKVGFSMLFCLVVATIGAALNGEIKSFSDVASKFAIIWASSQAFYMMWFGGTDTNGRLTDMKVLG
jgi:predicted PurR-regulated permease PerM